jgi:hypothetical protein
VEVISMPSQNSNSKNTGAKVRQVRHQGGMGGHAGASDAEFAVEANPSQVQQAKPDRSKNS